MQKNAKNNIHPIWLKRVFASSKILTLGQQLRAQGQSIQMLLTAQFIHRQPIKFDKHPVTTFLLRALKPQPHIAQLPLAGAQAQLIGHHRVIGQDFPKISIKNSLKLSLCLVATFHLITSIPDMPPRHSMLAHHIRAVCVERPHQEFRGDVQGNLH